MTDDATRSSKSGGPASGTRVEEIKIQVRLVSGKIYGPYERREIIAFIDAGRLKGQEEILIDGESHWKPITSDLDFFDAFQAILVGKKKLPKRSRKKIANEETKIRGKKNQVVDEKAVARTVAEATIPAADKITRTIQQSEIPSPEPLFTSEEAAPPAAFTPVSEAIPAPPPQAPQAPKKTKALLLGATVLGILVLFLLLPIGNKGGTANLNGKLISETNVYGKSLYSFLKDVNFKIPIMLPKIESSEALNLPNGLGAHVWVKDIQDLLNENRVDQRANASFWMRWIWDLEWLGETMLPFEAERGQAMKKLGLDLLSQLRSRKALTKSQAAFFRILPQAIQGQWASAQAELEKIVDVEEAQWLAEFCSWMNFWQKGAQGEIYKSANYATFKASIFDLSSQLRRNFVSKNPRVFADIEQLAEEDPFSFELWFDTAEYLWRVQSTDLVTAKRVFVTGLSVAALVPPAMQKIYWSQFSDFQSALGDPASSKKAAADAEKIGSGTLAPSKAPSGWWDLGDGGLDVKSMATQIFDRVQKGSLQTLDMASLLVIGNLSTEGSNFVAEAAYHFAYQGEWGKSIEFFKRARALDKKNTQILGGLLWAYSSLYKFDKALKILDEIKEVSSSNPEAIKFTALFHMMGREYEEAQSLFAEYLKQSPTNGQGHYFKALLSYTIEKNIDCAKAANLARVYATGELKLRSILLFYRCRILSKLAVKETLLEMSNAVKKEPGNIPLLLEWIDAQANADLSDAALKTAQDAVASFPRSYELRLKLAEVYQRRENFDLALAFYNDAKKDRPNSAEASVRIAKVFESQDKFFEAAQNYETAARIDPDYPDVWIFAARAYGKIGRYNDSAQMYIREIEARPTVLSTFLEAAEFMLKINAPQQVPEIFRKFSEDFHGDPRVLTRLAQAYLAMNDLENARQTAALALAADPKIPEDNRILAIVYDQQGQIEAARGYFENYLTLLPQANDGDQIRAKLSYPPYKTN